MRSLVQGLSLAHKPSKSLPPFILFNSLENRTHSTLSLKSTDTHLNCWKTEARTRTHTGGDVEGKKRESRPEKRREWDGGLVETVAHVVIKRVEEYVICVMCGQAVILTRR